jgi:hypothetical protein
VFLVVRGLVVVRDIRLREISHGTCEAQAEVSWIRSAGSCFPAVDLLEVKRDDV